MDIKQLRYFIAIAEEGSLSAASQRLRVARPAFTARSTSSAPPAAMAVKTAPSAGAVTGKVRADAAGDQRLLTKTPLAGPAPVVWIDIEWPRRRKARPRGAQR